MIDVRDLSTTHGRRPVLDRVSLRVAAGQVTAVVSPVAAEATSLVRAIVGLDRAGTGSALIDGAPYGSLDSPLTAVGTLLAGAPAHPARTARDHLRWMAAGSALPSRRVDDLLEMVGLGSVAGIKVRDFTPALRVRLGVASAMLGDPDHYVLDDPLRHLDGLDALWLRQVLRRLAARGKAVLVTGDSLGRLAAVADRVVVLGHGRIVADEDAAALRAQARPTVVLRAQRQGELFDLLQSMGADVTPRLTDDGVSLEVSGLSAQRISEAAVGFGVLSMVETDDGLADTLARLAGGAVPRVAVLAGGGMR